MTGQLNERENQSAPLVLPMGPLFGRRMPMWKRVVDVAGSSMLLIAFSPMLLLLSIYIKTVSRGPIFFPQERIGYRGRVFTMWKFRSMRHGADTTVHREHVSRLIKGGGLEKPMEKLDADPQIIPLGRIIRKLCLDELPQLYNVFTGEMSLVGPRPALPYEVSEYTCWHRGRFDCVPGMTGLWQVSGKNRLSFKQMVSLDIRYSRGISPWLDLKILAKTAPAIMGQLKDGIKKQLDSG